MARPLVTAHLGPTQPVDSPPPTHLAWAIVTTVACCLPLGIVSIVFAAQVSSKWAAGDAYGATEASRRAGQFAMWSALTAVIVVVPWIVLAALGELTAS